MTSPQVPNPAGSAFFAIDVPEDERAAEAHLKRIVALLHGMGYRATVLTGEQVMEAGALIARRVAGLQEIDQSQPLETDA